MPMFSQLLQAVGSQLEYGVILSAPKELFCDRAATDDLKRNQYPWDEWCCL